MKSQSIAYLFNGSEHIYWDLSLESALNMTFIVKWPSRIEGQCFFQSWMLEDINFQSGSKTYWEGYPRPDLTPPKVHRGV